jgi:hypothetical protein
LQNAAKGCFAEASCAAGALDAELQENILQLVTFICGELSVISVFAVTALFAVFFFCKK